MVTRDGRIERADTKEELVHVLTGIRHAIVYGLVACDELKRAGLPEIAERIDGKHWGFENQVGSGHASLDLSLLAAMLRSPQQSPILHENFAQITIGALLRTSYEIVFHYCKQTSQVAKFYGTPFAQFARVVRNLLSHYDGAELTRWPDDLKKRGVTSVRWNARTISESDIGRWWSSPRASCSACTWTSRRSSRRSSPDVPNP